jgi:hypothetical protein
MIKLSEKVASTLPKLHAGASGIGLLNAWGLVVVGQAGYDPLESSEGKPEWTGNRSRGMRGI